MEKEIFIWILMGCLSFNIHSIEPKEHKKQDLGRLAIFQSNPSGFQKIRGEIASRKSKKLQEDRNKKTAQKVDQMNKAENKSTSLFWGASKAPASVYLESKFPALDPIKEEDETAEEEPSKMDQQQ